MEKALAVVSGGIKSAVLMASQRASYELHLLHVDTGGPASPRVQAGLERLCAATGFSPPAVIQAEYIRELNVVGTDQPADSPGRQYALLRNLLSVLGVAVPYGYRHGLRLVLVGLCDGGASPAQEFVQIFNELLVTACPEPATQSVTAPFVGLSYAEVIKLGHRLSVPFELAWSCEGGGPAPCRACPGCLARATAFLRAGILDPLSEPVRAGL